MTTPSASTTTPATSAAAAAQPSPELLAARAPQRMRHELRRRSLTVQSAERVTPHCIRITLTGPDLEGFDSAGFDDHVKLILPDPATGQVHFPVLAETGGLAPDSPRPTMRDYTPRHHDIAARTLTIDFALHDAGPATQWALQAAPGQTVGVGGQRGSMVIPTAFDGYVLIGDDTALPAIARRLTELPAGAPVLVLAEVDGPADEQPLPTAADARVVWVHRKGAEAGTTDGLLQALRAQTLPAGDFHAWVACESAVAKALRAHLVGERGAYPKWVKASGYWRRGTAATHDTHED